MEQPETFVDIRDYHAFLKNKHRYLDKKCLSSKILYRFTYLLYHANLLSIWGIQGRLFQNKIAKYDEAYFIKITDKILTFLFITPVIILMIWFLLPHWLQILFSIICYYMLFDHLVVTLRDVFLAPILQNNKIRSSDYRRWALMTFFSTIQVVLTFAVIILFFSDSFSNCEKQITNSITAIYVSFVNFFTLGFGDYPGNDIIGKILVIFELLFFFLFLVIKLPIAISMIKTEEKNNCDKGKEEK